MTAAEVADALNVRERTIRLWIEKRREIPFVKIGGAVRFRPCDVAAYVERKVVGISVGATAVQPSPSATTDGGREGEKVQ